MDAGKMIIDKSATEEYWLENVRDHVTDHLHPKVTAKKTFFDLHHARRSRSTGSDHTNYHPKIKWTAGTTEIGSTHQTTTTYSDYMEQDIMKPVLQRDPSTSDPVSSFLHNSKSHLPPVSVTWAPMDIEPTRPEEIQHLFDPSAIISRPEKAQEIAKPKKKFLDKFRKGTKPVTSDAKEEVIPNDSEVEKILPEEEFRLLNERYIREGIISVETVKKHEYFAASLPQFTLNNYEATDKHEHRIPDFGHHSDKNGKISQQSLIQHKMNSNDKNIQEVSSNCSPLPARRSCEPVDIKDLRKLRDLDCKPGPSGINQQENVERFENMIFTSQSSKISIFDPWGNVNEVETPHFESQEDLQEIIKDTTDKIDRFKIDSPFSDFALQTINQQKKKLKPHINESPIKKKSQNRDSKLSGSSKAAHMMDHRQKVSYNLNVKKRGKKISKESFIDIFIDVLHIHFQPNVSSNQNINISFL